MKRIILAVTNDVVTDQRVDRTCRTLIQAGYSVTLIGRRLPDSPSLTPRPYSVCRMRLLFKRNVWFYAEYNVRLFLKLLFAPADAFWANDTDTLPACTLAALLRRRHLCFDAHELFPDVPELIGRPRVQAVWRKVERICLPRVDAAFTVCQSVADVYHSRYGINMTVVRNLPLSAVGSLKVRSTFAPPYTLLYQGAVNVGRGVRELVDAMQHLPQCRLVVAGVGDLYTSLRRYASTLDWSDRIQFLGRLEPDRLHALTAQAHLGLCLLEDLGLNYRYSLPNRIADFAQAGVPILATNFPEIARILSQYGTGDLTEPCPALKEGEAYRLYLLRLASDINSALQRWGSIPPATRQQIFSTAASHLCWDNEQHLLLSALRPLL